MPRFHRLEDQALLLCAHQDLTAEYSRAIQSLAENSLDWSQVLELARANHIAPLVHTNLEKAGVTLPPDVAVDFKKDYIDNLLRKKEARSLLKRALDLIHDWQATYRIPIRSMLVKGAALGVLVYREPWYTRSADIDLLFDLPGAKIPQGARRQLMDGLDELNSSSSRYRTHLEFDFYSHHDLTLNGLLPIDADRVWRSARPVEVEGHCLFVMSPEDILIAAAVACCRRRYFYLKPLLDLSECTRHLENLSWERVIETAQADRVNSILYTGLWLAKECLEAPVPAWVFSGLKISSLHRRMIPRLASCLMAHFPLTHLTRVWSEGEHPLTAALLLTYFSFTPAQSTKHIIRSLGSVLHD